MIIAPKIADHDFVLNDDIQRYMHGVFEIHMVNTDLQQAFKNCVKIMDGQPDLKEVVLHTPFTKHTLSVYLMSNEQEQSLIRLIVDCIKYSTKKDIKLGILLHAETCPEYFSLANGEGFLRYLLSLIKDTNVYILMENSLPTLSAMDVNKLPLISILNSIDNEQLKVCLDICHLHAWENCTKEAIVLPESVIKRIHEIHFSAVLNNDGWLNKKLTHGRVHPTYESLKDDLQQLIDMGIDFSELIITSEICEKDLQNRPDMVTELKMLYKAIDELSNTSDVHNQNEANLRYTVYKKMIALYGGHPGAESKFVASIGISVYTLRLLLYDGVVGKIDFEKICDSLKPSADLKADWARTYVVDKAS